MQAAPGSGGRRGKRGDRRNSNSSRRTNRKKGGGREKTPRSPRRQQNGKGRGRNRNSSDGGGVKVIRRVPSDNSDGDPRSPKSKGGARRRQLPPMVLPSVRVRRESGLADLKRTKEARRAARAAAGGSASPGSATAKEGSPASAKRKGRGRRGSGGFEEASAGKPVEVKRGIFLETDVSNGPRAASLAKNGNGTKSEAKRPTVQACDLSHFENIENGLVFVCTSDTEKEVFAKRLFGLPLHYMPMMRQIDPAKTALFLAHHDGNERVVYGVFQAAGAAGLHDVSAFGGRFPAQVPFKDLFRFPNPLPERVLVESIFHSNFRSRILEKRDTHSLIAEFYNSLMNPLTTRLLAAQSREHTDPLSFPNDHGGHA